MISNVILENVDIKGGDYVGGLVGVNNLLIANCHVTGRVEGNSYIGGLVGELRNDSLEGEGKITNSSSYCSVFGFDVVGGLIGHTSYNTKVEKSFSTGNVTGVDYLGGFIGFSESLMISNSYSRGNIFCPLVGEINHYYQGGFIGFVYDNGNISLTIENCYSTGFVEDWNGTKKTDKGFIGYIVVFSIPPEQFY